MSLLSNDTIKLYGESVGLRNLKEDVQHLLCHDTEYRLREIIQEASKFMKYSNRCKLTTEDIQAALKLKRVDPIFGYDPSEPFYFKNYVSGKLWYLEDKEVDFDSIISAPLPRIPHPMTLSSHWLAIEGVQPQVPENPSQSLTNAALGSTNGASLGSAAGVTSQSSSLTVDGLQEKYVVKHHLSKEHQMYFETVTTCLFSKDLKAVQTALQSLKNDAGIQQLLPYLMQFIAEMVMKHLRQLNYLVLLLKVVNAILQNTNLFIEPYLHQLMPTLLTCIIGKRLGESPEADHWSLREEASRLIALVCAKYGEAYPNLLPRIFKTLMKALMNEEDRKLPPKFGAIRCFSFLGKEPIEIFVWDHLSKIGEILKKCVLESPAELDKSQAALLMAIGKFLKEKWTEFKVMKGEASLDTTLTPEFKEEFSVAFQMFGEEALMPYILS